MVQMAFGMLEMDRASAWRGLHTLKLSSLDLWDSQVPRKSGLVQKVYDVATPGLEAFAARTDVTKPRVAMICMLMMFALAAKVECKD
jgi:hypothetical protein